MKDSTKSVNCNSSICSTVSTSHALINLGEKKYAFKHLTLRENHITILIIIIVMMMHKWASVGLMASHEHLLSSLAHLSTDSFWHKMARVRYTVTQNDLCASLCKRKHICGNETADTCRYVWSPYDSGYL